MGQIGKMDERSWIRKQDRRVSWNGKAVTKKGGRDKDGLEKKGWLGLESS